MTKDLCLSRVNQFQFVVTSRSNSSIKTCLKRWDAAYRVYHNNSHHSCLQQCNNWIREACKINKGLELVLTNHLYEVSDVDSTFDSLQTQPFWNNFDFLPVRGMATVIWSCHAMALSSMGNRGHCVQVILTCPALSFMSLIIYNHICVRAQVMYYIFIEISMLYKDCTITFDFYVNLFLSGETFPVLV